MSRSVEEFNRYRKRMNEKILATDNLEIKRFFNLDNAVYKSGALDDNTKELLGLVASMVLRCNDCIAYHVQQCVSVGVNDAEFDEAFSIALIVGGSIVIPHLRYAVEFKEQMRNQGQ
jgi:AhpD family alkylhydroperoxidase